MLTRKLLLVFSLSWLLGAHAVQSYAQGESLSLREAIRHALEENPRFRSFAFRSQAVEGERSTANLKPELRVSGQIENLIGTGDLNWFQRTEFTLAMSRVIELGDKLAARGEVVSRRQSLLSAQQRVLELEVIGDVTRRYIELAATQQRRAMLQRAVTIDSDTLDAVTARVESGRAPLAERARAGATLQISQLAVQSIDFDIAVARVRLSSLWNDIDPDFLSASANLMQFENTVPIDVLLDRLEHNPAILIYADESRLRNAQMREAQSRRKGDIEVSVGVRHIAELDDSAFTLQASVPLFSNRRASGAIETARANLALVESERASALLLISSRLVDLNLRRSQAANEVQGIQQNVMPQLQTALNDTQSAFSSGRYSLLELNAAQSALLQADQTLINAATRVHLLTAEIEQLSGDSLTASATGASQ